MRYYEVGSPAVPNIVIADEPTVAKVVADTIAKGRRMAISRPDRVGMMAVWRVMDGMVVSYEVNGKERPLLRWPPWVHRMRKLLARYEADKETA